MRCGAFRRSCCCRCRHWRHRGVASSNTTSSYSARSRGRGDPLSCGDPHFARLWRLRVRAWIRFRHPAASRLGGRSGGRVGRSLAGAGVMRRATRGRPALAGLIAPVFAKTLRSIDQRRPSWTCSKTKGQKLRSLNAAPSMRLRSLAMRSTVSVASSWGPRLRHAG
jgi:hypothetical protein